MSHPSHRALRDFQGLEPLTVASLTSALQQLGPLQFDGIPVNVTRTGLSCQDHEREHATTFNALAHLWEPTGLDPEDTPHLVELVRVWHESRPVPNHEALIAGTASLTWGNDQNPHWTVFVARGNNIHPWVPTFDADPTMTALVREHAWLRAETQNHDEHLIGDMTLWTHRVHPALSTGILACGDWVAALDVCDLYVIIAPSKTRAVLTGPHEESARLQQTSVQPMIVQHAGKLQKFRWR